MRSTGFRGRMLAVLTLGLVLAVSAGQSPVSAGAEGRPDSSIVNLAHLDFLHATVNPITPPAGHSTTDPGTPIDTWWVYANYDATTGTYTPTGGGSYDAATHTYGQGAFDTDDVARAAVVYLIHYRDYHDSHSLQLARGALRFVLYMQTTSGPNAGNFVLWMQPDGALNPSPTPPDAPSPADSGASYWLARSLWALGEGYATFRSSDPQFAATLGSRMELAMAKLDDELVTPNAGHFYVEHGNATPKWFIADGADASSEAMLGLSAYYAASSSPEAAKLARLFGDGVAGYHFGTSREWAWQALLPWARSISDWHAWGAHMSMALATGAPALGDTGWLAAAERDANQFETHLLTSFGPINGLLPAPDDVSQIAYGAETTTDGLLSLGYATGKPVYRELGGIAATWFFGNNPANAMMYQPATGVVYDGVNGDGTVNHNSGAESTIEGLLAVMNVANDPLARAYLNYRHVVTRVTYQKVEAESGVLSGGAAVVTPASAWTGEALWSNGAYVDLGTGGSDRLATLAPSAGRYAVYVVFDKQLAPQTAVGVRVSVDNVLAGTLFEGGAGAQGDSPNPDYLSMESIDVTQSLIAGPHTVTLAYVGEGTVHARVDAILLQPLIEHVVLADDEQHLIGLYKSLSASAGSDALPVQDRPTTWTLREFDRDGGLVSTDSVHVPPHVPGQVPVQPYGYTLATTHADE